MDKVKKNKGGRPKKTFDEIDLDKFIKIGEKGYTDKQICKIMAINEQTLNNYKKEYPEFFESLKRGKAIADGLIELSLYHRGMGYSHPDVHISNFQGVITKTPIIKHYPPDPTSMIFWLKNRKPKEWKDKTEFVLPGIDEILAKRRKNND